MKKEMIEIVNQDIITRVKEIRDLIDSVSIEVGIANQSAINTLRILANHLLLDNMEGDIASFAETILQKTGTIRERLVFIDDTVEDLDAI